VSKQVSASCHGAALFAALFTPGSASSNALSQEYAQDQARVLLVTADELLEAIPAGEFTKRLRARMP
jgi:hypothetical protein